MVCPIERELGGEKIVLRYLHDVDHQNVQQNVRLHVGHLSDRHRSHRRLHDVVHQSDRHPNDRHHSHRRLHDVVHQSDRRLSDRRLSDRRLRDEARVGLR